MGVNKGGGDEQGTGECHGLMCRWSESEKESDSDKVEGRKQGKSII